MKKVEKLRCFKIIIWKKVAKLRCFKKIIPKKGREEEVLRSKKGSEKGSEK